MYIYTHTHTYILAVFKRPLTYVPGNMSRIEENYNGFHYLNLKQY